MSIMDVIVPAVLIIIAGFACCINLSTTNGRTTRSKADAYEYRKKTSYSCYAITGT